MAPQAGVVREHLATLEQDGILHEHVHLFDIEVTAEQVAEIVAGARNTTRDIALAIMRLRPETPFPTRASVPALGAQRRTQALVVHGWTLGESAGFLGWHQADLSVLLRPTTTTITANKHVQIARMYRYREMTAPAVKNNWSVGCATRRLARWSHVR